MPPMADWEERISRETVPALRAEHGLRYRLAAPLVAEAAGWLDLGCGNGVAAADAFGAKLDGRAVLVDVAQDAVDTAAAELRLASGERGEVVPLTADLTDPAEIARVRAALLEVEGPRVVTCFEVVEHLGTFVPLVRMLCELAEAGEATVLLSVPNDAFFATHNPHHLTTWGAGAFAELRGLLPEGTVIAHQLMLTGSAIVPLDGGEPHTASFEVELRTEPAVPTHFLAIMGPQASDVALQADAVQADLDSQRAWEREREANVAYDQALVARYAAWFEEWRPYIEKLERLRGAWPAGFRLLSRNVTPAGAEPGRLTGGTPS